MNTCVGCYLNLFSDERKMDSTDLLDDKLDIYIIFAEWKGDDEMPEAELRARSAIEKWKNKYYPRVNPDNQKAIRSIAHKLKKVLEREFYEEAIFIHVDAKQIV